MNRSRADSTNAVNGRLLEQYVEIAALAGQLAHEIKNPLSTIRLTIELLAEDLAKADSPAGRRALTKIETVERECRRLQDLLDSFLTFARIRRLELEPANLNEIVEELVDFFLPKARKAGIELICYLDVDLPTVMLDREMFHAALLNLVLNAHEAMPDGGQLVIRTTTTSTGVALDLIDTGCGMDEDTRAQIFRAFFTTKRGGSGLGLPTARKIIEAHGAEISAQSEVGKGTQFRIELRSLPRLEQAPQASASQ